MVRLGTSQLGPDRPMPNTFVCRNAQCVQQWTGYSRGTPTRRRRGQAGIELRAGDAEGGCGLGLVALRAVQGCQDGVLLHFGQGPGYRGDRREARRPFPRGRCRGDEAELRRGEKSALGDGQYTELISGLQPWDRIIVGRVGAGPGGPGPPGGSRPGA